MVKKRIRGPLLVNVAFAKTIIGKIMDQHCTRTLLFISMSHTNDNKLSGYSVWSTFT